MLLLADASCWLNPDTGWRERTLSDKVRTPSWDGEEKNDWRTWSSQANGRDRQLWLPNWFGLGNETPFTLGLLCLVGVGNIVPRLQCGHILYACPHLKNLISHSWFVHMDQHRLDWRHSFSSRVICVYRYMYQHIYVCVNICVHVHVGTCAHMFSHMWRPEVDSLCVRLLLSIKKILLLFENSLKWILSQSFLIYWFLPPNIFLRSLSSLL